MPSEYQQWIAKDVKPDEKRELSPEEKRRNWWHYNKWYVVAVIAVVLCAISFTVSSISSKRRAPDLQIAYIGQRALPDDTVAALEMAFAEFGEDITGDGVVKVRINQYVLGEDVMVLPQLVADLTSGSSRIYLMEDPQKFQDAYGPLGYADGVFGDGNIRQEPLWYQWSQCPVLAGLELGTYEVTFSGTGLDSTEKEGSSQELLAKLYIGRRGIDSNYEHGNMDNAAWEKMIAGISDKK